MLLSEAWNKESVRGVYFINSGKIACKYTYEDLPTAYREVMQKFDLLQ